MGTDTREEADDRSSRFLRTRLKNDLCTIRLISRSNCLDLPVPVAARSKGVGLRPLTCWDREFESHRGDGCLSIVSVVCFQTEVSATS